MKLITYVFVAPSMADPNLAYLWFLLLLILLPLSLFAILALIVRPRSVKIPIKNRHVFITVHAAVQNHGKLKYFEEMKNLKVFYSDPFDFQSIMDALKGCCGLFYSFEPPSDQSTYDEMMADVEVRAAHNVLEACAQTDTIYKVVFTSSATALLWSNDRDKSLDVDERNWSDINLLQEIQGMLTYAVCASKKALNSSLALRRRGVIHDGDEEVENRTCRVDSHTADFLPSAILLDPSLF